MDYYLNLYTSSFFFPPTLSLSPYLLPLSYYPPSLLTSLYPSSSSYSPPYIHTSIYPSSSSSPPPSLLTSLYPSSSYSPPYIIISLYPSSSSSSSLYKHFGNASGTKGFSGSEPRLPGLSLKALQSCLVAVSGGFACVASRLVLSEFLLHGSQVKG